MEKMKKLSRTDRLEIEILLDKGHSYRSIAEAMGRSPNTISYEVKKNSTKGVYKCPEGGQESEGQEEKCEVPMEENRP